MYHNNWAIHQCFAIARKIILGLHGYHSNAVTRTTPAAPRSNSVAGPPRPPPPRGGRVSGRPPLKKPFYKWPHEPSSTIQEHGGKNLPLPRSKKGTTSVSCPDRRYPHAITLPGPWKTSKICVKLPTQVKKMPGLQVPKNDWCYQVVTPFIRSAQRTRKCGIKCSQSGKSARRRRGKSARRRSRASSGRRRRTPARKPVQKRPTRPRPPAKNQVPPTCPKACQSPEVHNGSPKNGGANLVGGICEKWASKKYGTSRYCGSGKQYSQGGGLNCQPLCQFKRPTRPRPPANSPEKKGKEKTQKVRKEKFLKKNLEKKRKAIQKGAKEKNAKYLEKSGKVLPERHQKERSGKRKLSFAVGLERDKWVKHLRKSHTSHTYGRGQSLVSPLPAHFFSTVDQTKLCQKSKFVFKNLTLYFYMRL